MLRFHRYGAACTIDANRWTPALVKEHLPNVKVWYAGKVRTAEILGRKLEIPEVWIMERDDLMPNRNNPGVCFDVTWDVITNCLQNDNPIIISEGKV